MFVLFLIPIIFACTHMNSIDSSEDPLSLLDRKFVQEYAKASKSMIPPIRFVASGSTIELYHNTSVYKANVVPSLYNDLKTVSHMPLAVYVLIRSDFGISESTRSSLEEYRQGLVRAKQALSEDRFVSTDQLERQVNIYKSSLGMVEYALSRGFVLPEELKGWARSLKALLEKNLEEAAESQILLLHSQVMFWKSEILSESDWKEAKVVIPITHMAAQDSLYAQYFRRLFQLPQVPECSENSGWDHLDERVFTLSGPYETVDAIDEGLSNHFVDYSAGEDFFGDRYRLHRDALADGTEAALNRLFS